MAAISLDYRATLYDLRTKSSREVFLSGVAYRSDVSVGGGPVLPDNGGGTPPDPGSPPETTPPGDKPPPEGAAGWGFYDGRWGFFPAPSDASPHR